MAEPMSDDRERLEREQLLARALDAENYAEAQTIRLDARTEERDDAIDRAEQAEADFAICFEEWGNSIRSFGKRNAELFIRANEAGIRAQAADVLRARLDEIGEPAIEYRFIDEHGTESDFDLHDGPCDCRTEARKIYAGPWLAAGGWIRNTLPSRDQVEQQSAHADWSVIRAARMVSPDAQAGYREAEAEYREENP